MKLLRTVKLPERWQDYLRKIEKTGAGYQRVNIRLYNDWRRVTWLRNAIVINSADILLFTGMEKFTTKDVKEVVISH